jgi:hypothetical protein
VSTFLPLLPLQVELPYDQGWWANLSFEPDEPNPQLGGLYENTPLLPYDTTDQDVLPIDSGAESLHELFNGGSTELAMQGTGVNIMSRQSQSNMQQNNLLHRQGIASRRLRLMKSLSNVKCGESATNVECEDEAACIVTSEYLDEAVEESTEEKGEPSDDGDAESTGITIRSMHPAPSPSESLSNVECGESATNVECEDKASCIVTSEYQDEVVEESTAEKGEPSDDDAESTWITIRSMHPAPSPSATSSFTQQGTAVRRLRLKSDLNTGPCSVNDDSSCCIIDKTERQHNAGKSEVRSPPPPDTDLPFNCWKYLNCIDCLRILGVHLMT